MSALNNARRLFEAFRQERIQQQARTQALEERVQVPFRHAPQAIPAPPLSARPQARPAPRPSPPLGPPPEARAPDLLPGEEYDFDLMPWDEEE